MNDDLDALSVNTIRTLAMDAVQASNSGHPGTPMAMAAVAFRLVSIYGAEAGNLPLKMMATGRIYLDGGIPPKILPKLVDGAFIGAFLDKGPFTELLERIPVRVILNDKAALLGAARHAALNRRAPVEIA